MTNAERKIAAFIGAYEALCLEHGMCVLWVEETRDGAAYERSAVGVLIDGPDDPVLSQACEEMRIGPVVILGKTG